MANNEESKPKTFYAVVYPDGEQKEKISFYPERNAAEKAAKASGLRPGTVHAISV